LARVTKLPIQYAPEQRQARHFVMQMELDTPRWGVIPEQKAEPEDPKQPDELWPQIGAV